MLRTVRINRYYKKQVYLNFVSKAVSVSLALKLLDSTNKTQHMVTYQYFCVMMGIGE